MNNEQPDAKEIKDSFFVLTRRKFIATVSVVGAGFAFIPLFARTPFKPTVNIAALQSADLQINVNGISHSLSIDSRMSLLDLLREKLALHGSKKGCDHGQCGACTVLVNGTRVNGCLTLALTCDGADITSIEGLANGSQLHPMQEAFIKHDAFQCGYCTPGQICSAVGLIKEGHAKTDADIQELMSGNICRCGAYRNILDAVKEVQLQSA
jgi:xanthine dehydrogenase YagT iron-sulfur-binding subunit